MSAEHNGRVTVVDVTTEEGSVIAVEVTLGDSEVVLSGHPQGSRGDVQRTGDGTPGNRLVIDGPDPFGSVHRAP